MNRRTFIRTAALAAGGLAGLPATVATASEKPNWPIGCFNRPWTKWSYDTALESVAAAGYKLTGLLSTHPGEVFTLAGATPGYLDALKKRIAKHGLTANMTAIRFSPEAPLADNIADLRKQIDNASRLELTFMLTFGVDRPEHYENYYRLMADAAPAAEKRGLKLVLKPHGGGSGASEEILRCIEKSRTPTSRSGTMPEISFTTPARTRWRS